MFYFQVLQTFHSYCIIFRICLQFEFLKCLLRCFLNVRRNTQKKERKNRCNFDLRQPHETKAQTRKLLFKLPLLRSVPKYDVLWWNKGHTCQTWAFVLMIQLCRWAGVQTALSLSLHPAIRPSNCGIWRAALPWRPLNWALMFSISSWVACGRKITSWAFHCPATSTTWIRTTQTDPFASSRLRALITQFWVMFGLELEHS